MDQQEMVEAEASDQALILRARDGDQTAFAELWKRHARSGVAVARRFTSSLDADDLVSEAFTRIYRRVLDGGGPDGAFRPYLYTTIRNLASRWGTDRHDIQIEDIEDLSDDSIPEDPSTTALDSRLTAEAFKGLPERWQSVLWYTEVEGMSPHEVAPLLGLTANGVAALAYRAREGLRTAWLQAHVSDAGATDDCRWVTARLGENARKSLTKREKERFETHVAECPRCEGLASEVNEVGSSIALILLPLVLGTTVGGALLATTGPAQSAAALSLPAVPAAFQAAAGATVPATAVAASAGAGVGAAGAVTASAPVIAGALAVAVVLGGGAAAVLTPDAASAPQLPVASASSFENPDATSQPQEDSVDDAASGDQNDGETTDPVQGLVNTLTDPVNAILPDLPIGEVPEHVAPEGVVGALVDLDLNGKGMPGATVSAQVAGAVYTTVVAADGTWALRLTALPEGVGPIRLKQNLKILGITVPIDIPLTLLSDTLGITVELLN